MFVSGLAATVRGDWPLADAHCCSGIGPAGRAEGSGEGDDAGSAAQNDGDVRFSVAAEAATVAAAGGEKPNREEQLFVLS